MSRRAGQTTFIAENPSESRSPGERSESTSWNQVGRALYLPQELMGFVEGSGLLFLAGMANGVRFFAPPYWKIDQCDKRAALNPYYDGRPPPTALPLIATQALRRHTSIPIYLLRPWRNGRRADLPRGLARDL